LQQKLNEALIIYKLIKSEDITDMVNDERWETGSYKPQGCLGTTPSKASSTWIQVESLHLTLKPDGDHKPTIPAHIWVLKLKVQDEDAVFNQSALKVQFKSTKLLFRGLSNQGFVPH
jgi:hypothetical protein